MDFTPYVNLIRPDDHGDTMVLGDSPDPLSIVNDYPDAVLFLSDLDEFPLGQVGLIEQFWERINKARQSANTEMNTDLSTSLISALPARQFKSASIGMAASTQFVRPGDRLQTLQIPSYYFRGGELIVRAIGLQWSQAVRGQVISLYEKGSNTRLDSYTIDVPERSKQQVPLPKSWRLVMDGKDYELRTIIPDGVLVADNNISCCANTPNLTTLIPRCYTGKAGGWMVSISGACNYDPLLAQLLDNQPTRNVLAYMLAYLAAYKFLTRPNTGEIDRSAVLAETDLQAVAATCRSAYLNRLNWLIAELPNLPIDLTGTCFQKQPTVGWGRNGLIG